MVSHHINLNWIFLLGCFTHTLVLVEYCKGGDCCEGLTCQTMIPFDNKECEPPVPRPLRKG